MGTMMSSRKPEIALLQVTDESCCCEHRCMFVWQLPPSHFCVHRMQAQRVDARLSCLPTMQLAATACQADRQGTALSQHPMLASRLKLCKRLTCLMCSAILRLWI